MSIKAKASRIVAMIALFVLFSVPAFAADQHGSSIQPYNADAPIDNGTVVELAWKNSDTVKPASQNNAQNMFGVTIDRNSLPITYSTDNLKNATYVAVSGVHDTLVSDQAGAIKSGDYVALSSINGVAMKASTDDKTVLGRAYGNFDGSGVVLGTSQLKDTNGKPTKTVKLGTVPVTIDIKNNPNTKTTKLNVPDFLERAGLQIAEKEVNPIRIYLSMAISAISLIMAIAVLYSGIRSSVISIGRNPMSKKSIFRALMEVILTSLLILIIGLFAVYLLLKL